MMRNGVFLLLLACKWVSSGAPGAAPAGEEIEGLTDSDPLLFLDANGNPVVFPQNGKTA